MTTLRKNTPIADRVKLTDPAREDLQKKIEKNKEEDLRMVRGIFKNLECPNGSVRFSQRKYKGEQVREYVMWDGREYEVPLYVAKYLNNNCAYPVHAASLDADGKPSETVGKMVNRFAFISTEYR